MDRNGMGCLKVYALERLNYSLTIHYDDRDGKYRFRCTELLRNGLRGPCSSFRIQRRVMIFPDNDKLSRLYYSNPEHNLPIADLAFKASSDKRTLKYETTSHDPSGFDVVVLFEDEAGEFPL